MNGPLAQIVTLSAFGNDFLYTGRLPVNFYENNLSFKFCNKIDFRVFKQPLLGKKKEVVIAGNPIDWFRYLKENDCKKLRLLFQGSKDQSFAKDHQLAGLVGGGGTWLIEAIHDNHSNVWANHWEVTQKDDPQHNIWTVNYGMTANNFPSINVQIDQQQCKNELNKTLSAIEAFAFHHNLEYWGNQFKAAKEALHADNPENSYYNTDLIPADRYSHLSKQILFAAGTAWVFGAMGSWNDLGFETKEDNDKYDSLTGTLYERVNQAIISATNSY